MTTATEVASYIVARTSLPNYDTKKLQKLVYFSQAWALAWTGKALFSEEFQAWPDGPVVRSLYAVQTYEQLPSAADGAISADQREVIDSVLEHYGHLSYTELIDLAHAHKPWRDARGDLPPAAPSQAALSESLIREYYTRLAITEEDSPIRRSTLTIADPDLVREVGQAQSEKWRSGLDILATT